MVIIVIFGFTNSMGMISKDYLGPYYVIFLSITSSFIDQDILHKNFFSNTSQQLSNYFTFTWPCCIVTNFFIIKPTRCTNFTNLFWTGNSTCFGQFLCPSSEAPSWSCSKAVYKPVWHIPLLSVQWIISWWWTEELS